MTRGKLSPMLGLMLASIATGTSYPDSHELSTFFDNEVRPAPPVPTEGAPGSNPARQQKNAAKKSAKKQKARRGRR